MRGSANWVSKSVSLRKETWLLSVATVAMNRGFGQKDIINPNSARQGHKKDDMKMETSDGQESQWANSWWNKAPKVTTRSAADTASFGRGSEGACAELSEGYSWGEIARRNEMFSFVDNVSASLPMDVEVMFPDLEFGVEKPSTADGRCETPSYESRIFRDVFKPVDYSPEHNMAKMLKQEHLTVQIDPNFDFSKLNPLAKSFTSVLTLASNFKCKVHLLIRHPNLIHMSITRRKDKGKSESREMIMAIDDSCTKTYLRSDASSKRQAQKAPAGKKNKDSLFFFTPQQADIVAADIIHSWTREESSKSKNKRRSQDKASTSQKRSSKR